MTRLLVSVRNAAEAEIAVRAGADLVDVKEPARGPLGMADVETLCEIVGAVGHRAAVSAALGELVDWQPERSAALPAGLEFAKFGLARCDRQSDWPGLWERTLTGLPQTLTSVAVVYADWRVAEAPPPQEIITAAPRLGCGAVLVDTFEKQGPGLVDLWSQVELRNFIAAVRGTGLITALAGRLTLETLPRLLDLEPDYIGVRGAACHGGRSGAIDFERVRRLSALVAGHSKAASVD